MRYCRDQGLALGPKTHPPATIRAFLLALWPAGSCRDLPQLLDGQPLPWHDVQRQYLLSQVVAWILSGPGVAACADKHVDIVARWNDRELPDAVDGFAEHPGWVDEESLADFARAVGPDVCSTCLAFAADQNFRSHPTPVPRPTESQP